MNEKQLQSNACEGAWTSAALIAGGMAAAAGTGALLMFFFDPDRGKARRTTVRDKTTSTVRHGRKTVEGICADLSNRAYGVKSEIERRIDPAPVDDAKLTARVRAKLGRFSSHPHAVGVKTHDGEVLLTGHVLVDEVDRLLIAVRLIPGVESVENRMSMHETITSVPELGGELPKLEETVTV
ncbi:MAG: BON domain-containing protein [Bryobacteraceae bacterium]